MMRNKAVFVITLLGVLFSASFAAAVGDVAYIYQRNFKIDQNIVDVFHAHNLTVDFIPESRLPSNFSAYKFLFVGDESYARARQIPINDYPSVVVNSYNGQDWGLTDAEGVSSLGADHPLNVQLPNGFEEQVYTQATEDRRPISLQYYFLDVLNEAPTLQTVALTEPTSSGDAFGDVVAFAAPGSALLNRRAQRGKLCFYGIVRSDFWTPAAEDLFDECIGYVASACSVDTDCPVGNMSEPFCMDGGVYKTNTTYRCVNPGQVNARCVAQTTPSPVQNCSFGCANGACIAGVHDVALVNFTNAINNIRITSENGTDVLNTLLVCNMSYRISVTVENQGNFSENVTFSGMLDGLNVTHVGESNLLPGEAVLKTRTINVTAAPGTYSLSLEALIANDSNLLNNHAQRTVQVFCPTITCRTDFDCDDMNNGTIDRCEHPGTPQSNCTHTPTACHMDSECGETGFIGEPFCSMGDVYRNFKNAKCLLPGTVNARCDVNITAQRVEDCPYGCANGMCVRCTMNSDCNDNNSTTEDICQNPGTPQSQCTNNPINITCSRNSDCGIDGYVDGPVCVGNNVTRIFESFMCSHPGTNQSFCSSTRTQTTVQTCLLGCTNGTCIAQAVCGNHIVELGEQCDDGNTQNGDGCSSQCRLETITCQNDSNCQDNNPLTLDRCVNPGTPSSRCENVPLNCAADLDCGPSGFVGSEYCAGNDVLKNFQNALCRNPGTLESNCLVNVTPRLLTTCEFACAGNGICVRCDQNSDCNDNNPATQDMCRNPGTVQSFCTNEHNVCTTDSDCGFTGFVGDRICSMGDVFQQYQESRCMNAGTNQATCVVNTTLRLRENCDFTCTNGECNRCMFDFECSDNNMSTQDRCVNPGTPQSHCTNEPIACFTNNDCGTDGFVGGLFCTGLNVSRQFQSFTCHSPGTSLSFCSSSSGPRTVQICADACANGACEHFTCRNDSDCDDMNNATTDMCINPATPQSYCRHDPTGECIPGQITTCGVSSVGECRFGTKTCQANGFYGACTGAVNPVNELCDAKDNDCDGAVDETFPNLFQTCSVGVGQCARTGMNVCSLGGLTTMCNANAGTPQQEVCNGLDDDCDGQTDEGSVCGPTCTNECSLGTNECVGNGARTCGNYDSDSCTEWSSVSACSSGQTCSNGQCTTPTNCSSQCTNGARQCTGNGFQICRDYNNDGCTEWGMTAQCGFAQTCTNGACVPLPPPTCSDECSGSERQCIGNAYRVCGNFDSDSCREWSTTSNCGLGQVCSSGMCVPQQPTCTNQCVDGSRECNGNGYRICRDYNNDGCSEWSVTSPCGFNQACSNGLCVFH